MSVFLEIPESTWIVSNALAFAVFDAFPVSKGHALVITKEETKDWFSATPAQRSAIVELIDEVKRRLDAEFHPEGYNVGFNVGPAGGQTIMHLHVHVIPRYGGDVADPRGGIRHVIPGRANYHRAPPLSTGGAMDPFARHIVPRFDRARQIVIVAAFVQQSGLVFLEPHIRSALGRGARLRILTGDYLDITQVSALEMLLDWQQATQAAAESEEEAYELQRLELRVVETEQIRRAFHPKAWIFENEEDGVAFVGSSNVSRSALIGGIEWNLCVERARDPHAYAQVMGAFELLWQESRILDSEWVEAYADRVQRLPHALPADEKEFEPLEPAPTPHEVQIEALAQLRASRAKGRTRALVVLATGLGKTWLAAFDYQQLEEELGRRPRLLFVAHRQELLLQAATTYRRLFRARGEHARVGWFLGERSDLSSELVFASVAKLGRKEHAAKLASERFDYVVIDEVHHAAADSYRRILESIEPHFLLGLTATPDRADARDILGLFDDHEAFRADIGRGVGIGRLVPFRYFGVRDNIDYANIPWRNRRFDPDVLATAVQTESRMQTLWRSWVEHPGRRTLVFCCSIAHASFVREWLRARGVRVAAVFAAPGSDDRESSMQAFERGDLDAVCSIDIFNEGVDVPSVDRIVMLRPTESGIVFLQQLGRGLRACAGKSDVAVIDFVGNHRVFLERLRTLLSLGGADPSEFRTLLTGSDAAHADLPSGCSVDIELEAKELLARLFRVSAGDEVERAYRELRAERDDEDNRPTAGELERMGYSPARLRSRHGSWFDFVRAEGDLKDAETSAFDVAPAFLRELETMDMSQSFKVVALEAMLEEHGLREGSRLDRIAQRSHSILRRSPELMEDVPEALSMAELDRASAVEWESYFFANAIEAWTRAKKDGRTWFRLEGQRILPVFSVPTAHEEAFENLLHELVDYRLAQYRRRKMRTDVSREGFVCRVTWNQRDPILKLPNAPRDRLPSGETDVRVDDSIWLFRFAKEFCNVARPAGVQRNALPDLLIKWFGPNAGKPGTAFDVRFRATPDGWWAEPLLAEVVNLRTRRTVVAYPDLRAAAGHVSGEVENSDAELVALPVDSDVADVFAVRISGSSMDGGREPMRDGDWAVMRPARSAAPASVENRVVLVQVPGSGSGHQYQIKRLRNGDGHWTLTSDNPDGPTFEGTQDTIVVARVEQVIRPEDIAPRVGATVGGDGLAQAFGLEQLSPRSERWEGHLFIFIDRKGMLEAPDRVRFEIERRRSSETSFVLARLADESYRYLGVGYWFEDERVWRIPDVDYATWRAWGEGRETSRRLPPGMLSRAQLAVDALLASSKENAWIQQPNGRRARLLGAASGGGLRIDGGEGGFRPRTISLIDVAWVIVADDARDSLGGMLDEAQVNRVRYLEGTPKDSTRWIDTGWALAAWEKAKPLVRASALASALRKLRGDDGAEIDASFRVEPVGDAVTIVIESRGGTRGTDRERNAQYAEGLLLILERLARRGCVLQDALVESRETEDLPPEERRIVLGREYPITIDDPDRIRREISAGQARVGRAAGARGSGNRTKRIRLYVGVASGEVAEFARFIEVGTGGVE